MIVDYNNNISENIKMNFDYIIIGGGSSGCVTANKLVNNNANVLLIEEGGSDWNPLLRIPAGFIPMLDGSPYHRFHKSIPQKHVIIQQNIYIYFFCFCFF